MILTFAFLFASLLNAASCPNGKEIRYEWDDLPKAQQEIYIQTIKKYYQSGAYIQFSKRHVQEFKIWHNSGYFLPVHRCMLIEYHKALKKINPNCPLPYWDSSQDAPNIANAPLFKHNFFQLRDASACVQDQVFDKSMVLQYPNKHCLRRGYKKGVYDYQMSPQELGNIIRTTPTYDLFRHHIEYKPHPYIHLGVGGATNFQDFAQTFSPNDPTFFLHHVWIDKLWSNFQDISDHNQMAFDGPDSSGNPVSLDYKFGMCQMTVRQLMNIDDLCYGYAPPLSSFVGLNTKTSNVKDTFFNDPAFSPPPTGLKKRKVKQQLNKRASLHQKSKQKSAIKSALKIADPTVKKPLPPMRPVLDDQALEILGLNPRTAQVMQQYYEKNYIDTKTKIQDGKKVFGPDRAANGTLTTKIKEVVKPKLI